MAVLTPDEALPVSKERGLAKSSEDDRSTNLHRQLIGWIGLLLPAVLVGLALWRDKTQGWEHLDSVSAYYYSGAAAVFVGMLVSLALFLFTYRGFDNPNNKWDRRLTNWAAIAALLVALFPTRAPVGFTDLTWWREWVGIIHFAAAVALFLCFAAISWFLFTLSTKPAKQGAGSGNGNADAKKRRNFVYRGCSLIIVACIIWAYFSHRADQSIFGPESLALIAFSFSWLTKGYAVETLRTTLRRGPRAIGRAILSAIM